MVLSEIKNRMKGLEYKNTSINPIITVIIFVSSMAPSDIIHIDADVPFDPPSAPNDIIFVPRLRHKTSAQKSKTRESLCNPKVGIFPSVIS